MKVVIDIDEKDYNRYKNYPMCYSEGIFKIIRNGTPLPKGHGRLIDCERLQEVFRRNVVGYADFKQLFDIAPTIIPAERKEQE